MPNQKILIVDDDQNICELLRLYLAKEGYETLIAHDGEKALELFEQNKPNMVLLDVMMPKMDGWEVCRRIRAQANTPIIMLTAKGETFDKVLGLELGADDYVVKPFDSKEVVARIKAVLRRCNPEESGKDGVIQFENLSLDMSRYELKVKGKVVEAPPKELELLAYPQPGVHPRPAAGRGVGLRVLRRLPHHRRAHQAPAGKAGGRQRAVEPEDRLGRGLQV